MKILLEDLIGHRETDMELPEGADIRTLLRILDYERYDLFHTVNEKHKRYDFKLSEGDRVTIIPVLGGG